VPAREIGKGIRCVRESKVAKKKQNRPPRRHLVKKKCVLYGKATEKKEDVGRLKIKPKINCGVARKSGDWGPTRGSG